jgi:hypothetical protein
MVASAGTILLAAQAPRGSEHVEELLTGTLLWVTWPQIWKTLITYGAIGVVHWLLRSRFFTISLKPELARQEGWRIALWDFLFYALFGVVVTSSVAIAGVLVVFSFLVIPVPGHSCCDRLSVHHQAESPAGHRLVDGHAGNSLGLVHLIRNRLPDGSSRGLHLRTGVDRGLRREIGDDDDWEASTRARVSVVTFPRHDRMLDLVNYVGPGSQTQPAP